MKIRASIGLLTLATSAGLATAQPIVAQGDIAVGWSQGGPTPTQVQLDRTLELFSPGNPLVQKPDPFNQFPFIQGVRFDNTGGIQRNPNGFLIGMDFGTSAGGARLYQFNLQTGATKVLLNGFVAASGAPLPPLWSDFPALSVTRGAIVAVSPDNSKIAFGGSDSGQFVIFDYDATATNPLSNGRQTIDLPSPLTPGVTGQSRTYGVTWLNNTQVVGVDTSGTIWRVDATQNPPVPTAVGSVDINPGSLVGGQFSVAFYDETISPFLYLGWSNFTGASGTPANLTTNTLFVIDPRVAGFPTVATIDLSTAMGTLRTIVLDAQGNLLLTEFGSSASPPRIHRIDNATNPAGLVNNQTTVIYTSTFGSSFNGLDVAAGTGGAPPCYANCDASTGTPLLTPADFVCFLNKFRTGDPYANCDGSTGTPALTPADFVCFLNKFRAGC